ncbi:hypothetical protein GE061_010756 [Apolygus lucorum]|uniref:Uncharacterized protein n=1 Tax=Apolygus lucorum TaxID=248454 RepID=A0A6A4K600_APOLU|nr:hypothetical protein GE061_010756 [Apolygus lucorum]
MFGTYLWIAGQVIQRRWEAAFRDIFSSIDVLCPILIILQFCTFLKIATDRFKSSRFHLIVYFYRTEDVLEQHLKNLELMTVLKQMYSNQLFFCVSYLGFDFFVASYDTVERVISRENQEWIICTTSYCAYLISTIFILCRACEATKMKADKFDNQLYLLMNENKALRKNVKLQLYLKRKISVTFSGSHFFEIGYPLVSTIVAATTTYLIFLAQFSLLQKD